MRGANDTSVILAKRVSDRVVSANRNADVALISRGRMQILVRVYIPIYPYLWMDARN